MARKIRVYELARELGLTNKEGLELCLAMGIGVSSHSSSIEEAQADRVRRRAERDGLKRPRPPEGPAGPSVPQPATSTDRAAVASRLATASRPVEAAQAAAPASPTVARGALSSATSRATPPPGVVQPKAPEPDGQTIPAAAKPKAPEPDGQTIPARAKQVTGTQAVGAQAGGGHVGGAAPLQAAPGAGRATEGAEAGPAAVARSARSSPTPAPGSTVASAGQAVASSPPAERGPAPPARRLGPPGAVSPMTGKPIPPPPGFRRPLLSQTGRPVPPPPRPVGPWGGPGRSGGTGALGAPPSGRVGPPAGHVPGQGGHGRPGEGGAEGAQHPGSRGSLAGNRPAGPTARSGGAPGARTGGPGHAGSSGGPARPGMRAPLAGRPGPGGQAPRSPGARPYGPRPGFPTREPGATYRPGAAPGSLGMGGYRPGGGAAPSRGGRAGGPSGGPGGRSGQSRAGQSRRPRSRKQGREELEAQGPTAYVPSHAPVPEGEVIVERGSTAQDLAPRLNRSAADVVRFLLTQGEMVTATMSLSDEMIELYAAEIGAQVRLVDPGERTEAELQARYFSEGDDEGREDLLRPRPPVVTVMGHVDHGKTTLLDRIRESDVASGETGGITQHIGAYQVTTANGAVITFIDTPGHEAFTAMRARGAEVTDIVVLVVAADDGVMPQTVEAINHAKAAGVPIVVAINKVDRPDADPNRVMQQLADQGLVPERWGGDTVTVETSALQDLGVDDLLEQLLVVAELEELRANPEARPRGVVLEANLDPGKGPVATVIVQAGTLRVGDHVVAGAAWGRVKALIDDKGDNVKEAPPSFPAQVLGFDALPAAGDEFRVVATAKTAREIAEQREQRYRTADLRRSAAATSGGAKLEDIFEQIQRGETATLNLVVKADVQGSLEAVTESLRKLERDDVKLAFVHRAVGGISENDVSLAAASNATIIGFNVRPGREARALAAAQGVEVRTYEIIYKLIEDVQAAMVGMLAPEYEEVVTGEAEVRQVFRVPRVGAVAGCLVRSGVITRGSKVRFLRDGVIIWKGTVTSLRRFKEDVREVHEGYECGIGLSNNQDLREGDVIETYEEREIQRT